jgi:hypothetical protein
VVEPGQPHPAQHAQTMLLRTHDRVFYRISATTDR